MGAATLPMLLDAVPAEWGRQRQMFDLGAQPFT